METRKGEGGGKEERKRRKSRRGGEKEETEMGRKVCGGEILNTEETLLIFYLNRYRRGRDSIQL